MRLESTLVTKVVNWQSKMPGIGGDTQPTESIYDRIIRELDKNGDMPNEQYRRLVLLALSDIGHIMSDCKTGLSRMDTRIGLLESNSILLTARKHPKITASILVSVAVLTFFVVLHLGLGSWLLELFDIPALPTQINP